MIFSNLDGSIHAKIYGFRVSLQVKDPGRHMHSHVKK